MLRKKILWIPLIVISVIFTVLIATIAIGNSFRFRQEAVSIPYGKGTLSGVVTTPKKSEPHGIVVMIHGDGAMNATQDGLYNPWFERAADAGFATISWNKPGVGGSSGNWLNQSMEDRAQEVSAVIDWAKANGNIPTDTIILWGASQAGWVFPKVVAERDDINGVVAVGTAINWLDQGRYNLNAELAHTNATQADRDKAINDSDTVRRLLKADDGYAIYKESGLDAEPMSEDRWHFVQRNMNSDARSDLKSMANKNVPLLLLAGLHDRNVDMKETELVYNDTFGEKLEVKWINAVHSMARPHVDESEMYGLAVGVLWPRALIAHDALDSFYAFLSKR